MQIRGIDSVLIFVTDFERSCRWYQEVLGLTLQSQHGEFAVFETGNIPLMLHGGAQPCGQRQEHGSLISFAVDDYAAAKEHLMAQGCTFVFEGQSSDAVFGTFLDPDGNPLQISQRTG